MQEYIVSYGIVIKEEETRQKYLLDYPSMWRHNYRTDRWHYSINASSLDLSKSISVCHVESKIKQNNCRLWGFSWRVVRLGKSL